MAKFKDYILIFVSMFVSLVAIMVLLAMLEPRVFSLVPGTFPDSLAHAPSDSTGLSSHADSLESHKGPPAVTANAIERRIDSLSKKGNDLRQLSDSVAHQESKTKSTAGGDVKLPAVPSAGPDTLSETERKKMVQIFEAMDAESAARILSNMSDDAVKQVITTMKKRQSAKILSVLEPKHAARILKGNL